jgi:hypothetical protein
MKYILVLLLITVTVAAQDRPIVGTGTGTNQERIAAKIQALGTALRSIEVACDGTIVAATATVSCSHHQDFFCHATATASCQTPDKKLLRDPETINQPAGY